MSGRSNVKDHLQTLLSLLSSGRVILAPPRRMMRCRRRGHALNGCSLVLQKMSAAAVRAANIECIYWNRPWWTSDHLPNPIAGPPWKSLGWRLASWNRSPFQSFNRSHACVRTAQALCKGDRNRCVKESGGRFPCRFRWGPPCSCINTVQEAWWRMIRPYFGRGTEGRTDGCQRQKSRQRCSKADWKWEAMNFLMMKLWQKR